MKNSEQLILNALRSMTPANEIFEGEKNVPTAGTAVPLGTQQCKFVTIQARSSNTGNIYIGGATISNTQGVALAAGEAYTLFVVGTDKVYLDADTNGEGVTYLYGN